MAPKKLPNPADNQIVTTTGNIRAGDVSTARPLPGRQFRDAWRLDGNVISLDIEAAKPLARRDAGVKYAAKARELTAGYTDEEIATFDHKMFAARAMLAGKAETYQTDIINAEAAARGITPEELRDKIVVKADALAVSMATLTGQKGKAEADIAAATTEQDLYDILDALPTPAA